MLNRISNILNTIKDSKTFDVLDKIWRKQRIYNSEMLIDDKINKLEKSSHLIMNDDRMFIEKIKINIIEEYFQVTFDNGEFIHYDFNGKAYLSLNPNSNLYKLRLSRYDIKQII